MSISDRINLSPKILPACFSFLSNRDLAIASSVNKSWHIGTSKVEVERLSVALEKIKAQVDMTSTSELATADPKFSHPHYHLIPRYKIPVEYKGGTFTDVQFGMPLNIDTALDTKNQSYWPLLGAAVFAVAASIFGFMKSR